jgi:ParB family chromosome partitioning protein
MATAANKRRGLGRGLSSLLGDEAAAVPVGVDAGEPPGVKQLPIEFLHPGKYQPRKYMDEAAIQDLARSIEEKGILQPLLVRRDPDAADAYEIIAGERRWRAAQLAKIHDVPVIVKNLSDEEVLEVALIENLQRQDLSPLEEAAGYQRLMNEFSHTQEDLAKVVGKSRSHVANMMRLLGLPQPVMKMLNEGALSAGHARALLNAKEPIRLARRVVKRGLNVRQTEKLVQQETGRARAPKSPSSKDADTLGLERDLTNLLGLKTEIKFSGAGGSITIHYGSLDQLDDILLRLNHGNSAALSSSAPTGASAPNPTPDPTPDPTGELQALEPSLSTEDIRALLTPDENTGEENAPAPETPEPQKD